METHELTLTNIDSVRHLTASEDVVNAVAYAARAGASDRTAYRFVTALVMTASLMDRPRWPGVLRAVKELEQGHSHVFEWVDGDDRVCVADQNCTMTYAEYKKEENRS